MSGWSVQPGWFQPLAEAAFPGVRHEVIPPDAEALQAARADAADVLAGFSFGAHLLLGLDDPRPRILLAPFPDLKREAGMGGAVAATQIRQQLRWLRRDPAAAVSDFHARLGLDIPVQAHDTAALAWGLERMLAPGPPRSPLPPGSIAVAGRRDPLLDTDALAAALPELTAIDAGHHPQPLLAEAVRLQQDAGT